MFYQLPNGKVIEISTEQYFELTDEELEYLIAYNYGEILQDPWFGSVLNKYDNTPEDFSEITPDLLEVPNQDKISDLDIDPDVLEEN
jgi:hypothetical protein